MYDKDNKDYRTNLLNKYDDLYSALIAKLDDNECRLLDKLLELERELTRLEE